MFIHLMISKLSGPIQACNSVIDLVGEWASGLKVKLREWPMG